MQRSHMTFPTPGLYSELAHVLEDRHSTFMSGLAVGALKPRASHPTRCPSQASNTAAQNPNLPPRLKNNRNTWPKMCNYWSVESPCGHRTLLAGSNCYLIYAQLQRINDPTQQGQHGLPFEIPPGCMPNRRNVQHRYTGEFCSFECRNNALYGERCGTRDARYGPGSERIGVGWRY